MRNIAIIALFALAASLFTCEKVPDYCGKGELCNPDYQFCFAQKTYDLCGGKEYNPFAEGCINGNTVGTKCQGDFAVPVGTPCGGYALTTAATPPAGGGVTRAPDRPAYPADEPVIVSAVPEDGYEFVGWAGALTTQNGTETVVMNANKPLMAMFKKEDPPGAAEYTLTTTAFPDYGGNVSRDPGPNTAPDTYIAETKVTVTAAASPGYTFSGWSGSAQSKSAAISLTMDGSKTLVAMFTPKTLTLTVNASPAEAGTVYVDGAAKRGTMPVEAGTVSLSAEAVTGYYFHGWSGTATGTANPTSINIIDGDAAVTAIFRRNGDATPDTGNKKVFRVTIAVDGTGAYIDGGKHADGDTVTITAGTAQVAGQRFMYWTTSSDGVDFADANSKTTTFVMPARDVKVTAVFE